jgi:adenosylcobinamide-phosphate synthase
LKRSTLLPAAYLFDQVAGDPAWFPHPVRIIGFAISAGEAALRRPNESRCNQSRPNRSTALEFTSGAALTLAVVGSAYWLTAELIGQARRHAALLGDAIELILGWTCLAVRNLEEEATAVTDALERGDLSLARRRLARIVGRDTDDLDVQEISRALIETVAESASDGIMAPLFYMALGGVPLAMAYKAINTLDSMIGHADAEYFYFGKAAARLDDVANFLPARLTSFCIVAASHLDNQFDPQAAWHTWQLDGATHKSPNAGQPESAMAGALHVELGGNNTYSGELIQAQRIGRTFPPPTPAKAAKAIRLVSRVSLLGLTFGVLLTTLLQTMKAMKARKRA